MSPSIENKRIFLFLVVGIFCLAYVQPTRARKNESPKQDNDELKELGPQKQAVRVPTSGLDEQLVSDFMMQKGVNAPLSRAKRQWGHGGGGHGGHGHGGWGDDDDDDSDDDDDDDDSEDEDSEDEDSEESGEEDSEDEDSEGEDSDSDSDDEGHGHGHGHGGWGHGGGRGGHGGWGRR